MKTPWRIAAWVLAALIAMAVLWRFGDANPTHRTEDERRAIDYVNGYRP